METRNSKKRRVIDDFVDEDEDEDEFVEEDDEEDEDYEEDMKTQYLDDQDIDVLRKLKKEKNGLYDRFLLSKEIISSREISLLDILSCDISDEKRANLIEKLECLRQIDPCTDDYIQYRDQLRNLHTKYSIIDNIPSLHLGPNKVKSPLLNPQLQPVETEMSVFKKKIQDLTCNSYNRKCLEEKLDEFDENMKGEEKTKLKRWLNLTLQLPFDKITPSVKESDITKKIRETQDFLNKKLYGMKNVKERLMLFLNKKMREGNSRGCNIALIGKPGVGKTAIAKCLAECLNLPFAQVSFGGVTNPDFLMGHDYTYIGSRPGEISRCLIRMGTKNGILFFDEFDKASDKKEIMSTLLHITDFSQTNEFRDNYFPELTQDLSKIWFIYSMNELPRDPAMLDRLEVIKVDEYTVDERKLISTDYLFPKYLNELKIGKNVVVTEDGVKKIVEMSNGPSATKKGVRDLERCINLIIEKVYFFLCNNEGTSNAQYEKEYAWYKKMLTCVDSKKRVIIGSDIVEKILDDCKKETEVYSNMYM